MFRITASASSALRRQRIKVHQKMTIIEATPSVYRASNAAIHHPRVRRLACKLEDRLKKPTNNNQ
jgi:hypothetical protein